MFNLWLWPLPLGTAGGRWAPPIGRPTTPVGRPGGVTPSGPAPLRGCHRPSKGGDQGLTLRALTRDRPRRFHLRGNRSPSNSSIRMWRRGLRCHPRRYQLALHHGRTTRCLGRGQPQFRPRTHSRKVQPAAHPPGSQGPSRRHQSQRATLLEKDPPFPTSP